MKLLALLGVVLGITTDTKNVKSNPLEYIDQAQTILANVRERATTEDKIA